MYVMVTHGFNYEKLVVECSCCNYTQQSEEPLSNA